LIRYYFPFPQTRTSLYLHNKTLSSSRNTVNHPNAFVCWYAKTHQKRSLDKLSIWGSKLDFSYFNTLSPNQITTLKETFNVLLHTLNHHTSNQHEAKKLSALLLQWSNHIDALSPDTKHPSIPLFHPYIRKNILECHNALYAIAWQDLKQGRF
jgi:hypothetical protein